ncbi:MAG: hypothetical protein KDD04_10210, partial [Sinomicrobium sp.]|nr:hypothetical protein [Sinomicrobium sp.]
MKAMSNKEIHDRIDLLKNAFAYSLEYGMLTVGQRICLSQERAAWLRVLDILEQEDPEDMPKPFYVIPRHLEDNVAFIIQRIKYTKWIKPEMQWT